jgi:hypothetical protein
MPSNYVGDPTTAATTLSLMTGGDQPTAQSVRVPLERLADGVAKALQATREAGADNADGATITLGAGHVFKLITSVTTITAFAFTDDVVGRSALIVFDTVRQINHNATTLILPGGTNIAVAVGDTMQITRTTTGFRVDWYTRAGTYPLEYATQAEMEAGAFSTKAVSAGRQQYHPSAAKFWAHVQVTAGVPALSASYNVASITDGGVGLLTVTIANDFSGAFWSCSHSVELYGGGSRIVRVSSRTQGAVTLLCHDLAAVAADPDAWNVSGFGDH